MARTLRAWFTLHDYRFGLSLLELTPEKQGEEICKRYGFDLAEMHKEYDELGKIEADKRLLARLNAWSDG